VDKRQADIQLALEALLQAKALKAARTREWYRWHVQAFRDWLVATDRSTRLADLTGETVQGYLAYEASRNRLAHRPPRTTSDGHRAEWVELPGRLSAHSLNSKIRCLRAFGRWLVKHHWLPASPFEAIELAGAPKLRKKVLSADEINRIFALLNAQIDIGARDRAILWLFLDTGIRLSELATLSLERINLTDQDDGPWVQVLGKDRKERRIGLCPGARLAIQHYVTFFRPEWVPFTPRRVRELEERGIHAVDEPLFLTVRVPSLDRPAGQQLLPNAIQLIINRLAKRSGITGLSCHTFRRTFATQNLELGASPLDIMHDLGHTSLTMTNYYASLADQTRMQRHRQFSYMQRLQTKPLGPTSRRQDDR
jgi:site-specific recombinase XerD